MPARRRGEAIGASPMRRAPRRDRAGLALVVVLWLLVVLGLVATGFATSTGTETKVTANELANGHAEALADAGLQRAVAALFDLGPDTPWPTEGTPVPVTLKGGTVALSVQDERGLISLNLTPEPILREILRNVVEDGKTADRLTDAIVDWRDPDDDRHVNGGEAADYKRVGSAVRPSNAPFRTVAELRSVLGMDAATYDRLAPLVTVHSPSPNVDLNVAPEAVLRVLPGIDPATVELDPLDASRVAGREGRRGFRNAGPRAALRHGAAPGAGGRCRAPGVRRGGRALPDPCGGGDRTRRQVRARGDGLDRPRHHAGVVGSRLAHRRLRASGCHARGRVGHSVKVTLPVSQSTPT